MDTSPNICAQSTFAIAYVTLAKQVIYHSLLKYYFYLEKIDFFFN